MHPIIVRLPTQDYAKLRQLAARDEREIDRQAAWLLRQALIQPVPSRELATAGADGARRESSRPSEAA